MSQRQQILSLLLEVEREMRALDLWSETMPSAEALMSQQPFCVDTLDFHEWVQWLLLPRMEQIIVEQMPLPTSCDIAPMAEEAFKQIEAETDQLLQLIADLDRAVTEGQ
ncbi:YqcC family protein [Marinobacterium sp. YM272]|uniref:YqcC family protein n=1 Tax=Marinobacterium sp. YM272 TaxID=3421654 RepID=UPI003D7FCC99